MKPRKLIEKALREYNRCRSPEVTARLVSFRENSFSVEFLGSLCYSCSFYDYFDDLKYVIKDLGIEVEIRDVMEVEGGALVEFSVKKAPPGA